MGDAVKVDFATGQAVQAAFVMHHRNLHADRRPAFAQRNLEHPLGLQGQALAALRPDQRPLQRKIGDLDRVLLALQIQTTGRLKKTALPS